MAERPGVREPESTVPPPAGRPAKEVRGPPSARVATRLGAVTLGISLPRSWVTAHGLSAGEPLWVQPLADGALIVRHPSASSDAMQAIVDVRRAEPPEHVFRRLIATYLAGAREVVLTFPEGPVPQVSRLAREFCRRTIEPEIVNEDGREIRLRDVSRGPELAVSQTLRRMFELALDLQRVVGRSWNTSLVPEEAGPERRDDEIDRYAWLTERILIQHVGRDLGNGPGQSAGAEVIGRFIIARSLERIADHGVRMAEHGRRLVGADIPTGALRALTDYHERILQNLESAFRATESPDADRANAILDVSEAIRSQHDALVDRFLSRPGVAGIPPRALTSFGLVLESIDRTNAYSLDIAEVALDWAVGRALVPVDVAGGRGATPRVSPPTSRPKRGRP